MFVFCVLLAFGAKNALAHTWQPSQGHTQMPIWPMEKMPDALPHPKLEYVKTITKLLKMAINLWHLTTNLQHTIKYLNMLF